MSLAAQSNFKDIKNAGKDFQLIPGAVTEAFFYISMPPSMLIT